MSRVTGYFNTDFPEPPRQSPNASAETNTYATEKMVFGRGPGGGASLREAASLEVLFPSYYFISRYAQVK